MTHVYDAEFEDRLLLARTHFDYELELGQSPTRKLAWMVAARWTTDVVDLSRAARRHPFSDHNYLWISLWAALRNEYRA